MFKSKWNIFLVLLACTLLLPSTAYSKHPVERPIMIKGNLTITFHDSHISGFEVEAFSQTGVATHLGKYTTELNGVDYVFEDGDYMNGRHFLNIVLTAANGDQLFMTYQYYGMMPWTITGGTGRFVGANGSMSSVILGPVTTIGGFWREDSFSYVAVGTITY
jgi:hypothetical protein